MPSIGNSVHDIVLYDCALRQVLPKPTRRKFFLWKKADTEGIKQDLLEFGQSLPAEDSTVCSLWHTFKQKIKEVIEKRVPTKMTANRHSHPWINTTIRRSIRRKQRAHKQAKSTGIKKDMDRYKKLQEEVKFHIREAHSQYLEDIVS